MRLEAAIARFGGWVDLLKLDCERAEWEIARKAPNAIAGIGFQVIHRRETSKEGRGLWAPQARHKARR